MSRTTERQSSSPTKAQLLAASGAVACAAVVSVYLWLRKRHNNKKSCQKKEIPVSHGPWPFGWIQSTTDIDPMIRGLEIEPKEHGTFFRYHLGPGNWPLVISDPSLIVEVNKKSESFRPAWSPSFELMVPYGFSHGKLDMETWTRRRRFFVRSFAMIQMGVVARAVLDHTNRLMDEHLSVGRPIDKMSDIATSIVFDSNYQIVFGDDTERLKEMHANIGCKMTSFSLPHRFLWYFCSRYWAIRRANAVVKQIVLQKIESVKRKLDEGREDECFLTYTLRNDRQSKAKDQLTLNGLTGQIETFFVAGFDTFPSQLNLILQAFAENPDKQEQCYQELVRAGLPTNYLDVTPSVLESICTCPYALNCVKEMQRLFPRRGTFADCVEDVVIGGYPIRKGEQIWCNSYFIGQTKQFWENTDELPLDEYHPERFDLPVRKLAHFPFGFGPTNCPGQVFAPRFLTMIIAVLLARYRFKLVANPQKVVLAAGMSIATQAPAGFCFVVEER